MIVRNYVTQIESNVFTLNNQSQRELAEIFNKFCKLILNEPSDTLDKEALLRQLVILTEQAKLPLKDRKELLITGALIYISIFSCVRSIGIFMIEHREQIDLLMKSE